MTSARDVHILLASAALVALLSATVTACGTPSSKPTEESTTGTSATAPAASESPAADWQTVDARGAMLQIPADWSQDWDGGSILFKPPKSQTGFDTARTVFLVQNGLWEGTPEEIDYLGDDELADTKKGPSVKNARRLPDLKVNGATLFHIQAEDTTEWLDIFGTLNGSKRVTVSWVIHKSTGNRKEADAMIDPVMQTFRFS